MRKVIILNYVDGTVIIATTSQIVTCDTIDKFIDDLNEKHSYGLTLSGIEWMCIEEEKYETFEVEV